MPSFWERLREPVDVAQQRYGSGRRNSTLSMPLLSLVFAYLVFDTFTSRVPNAKSDFFWYSPIFVPMLIAGWWLFLKQIKRYPTITCNACRSRYYQGVSECFDCGSVSFTNNGDTFSKRFKKEVLMYAVGFLVLCCFFLVSDFIAGKELSKVAIYGAVTSFTILLWMLTIKIFKPHSSLREDGITKIEDGEGREPNSK